MTEPVVSDEGVVIDILVFHGDGLCPYCGSYSRVEWYRSTTSWECNCCHFELDLANSIKMCAIYKPEKNPHDIRETLGHIRKALGLGPALPGSEVPQPRSFWHPKKLALNFAVGLALEIGWHLFGVVWDVRSWFENDDE